MGTRRPEKHKSKMIGKLIGRLVARLEPSFQSDLERWLMAQNPKNGADLERLIKEYTYKDLGVWL